MKKKYYAPEMEELELDEPIVLVTQEGSPEEAPISQCELEEEG